MNIVIPNLYRLAAVDKQKTPLILLRKTLTNSSSAAIVQLNLPAPPAGFLYIIEHMQLLLQPGAAQNVAANGWCRIYDNLGNINLVTLFDFPNALAAGVTLIQLFDGQLTLTETESIYLYGVFNAGANPNGVGISVTGWTIPRGIVGLI